MTLFQVEKPAKAGLLIILSLGVFGFAQNFEREPFDDPMDVTQCDIDGWRMIVDGTAETAEETMWISNASHGDGGNWWIDVDEAAVSAGEIPEGQTVLWSDQNAGGSGGLIYTHRAYENVEVSTSFWPGWQNDGGVFLRSNGTGGAYQIMLDYRSNERIGGHWPEQISADVIFPYGLISEEAINPTGITWPAEDWLDIWNPDGFNEIRSKIWGETNILAWLGDEDHVVTDLSQGSNAPELNETGYVGLQIHAGEYAWPGGPNRYLWHKVRELDDEGIPTCIGTRRSSCNFEGYEEYDSEYDIGDPSKCKTLGEAVRGCMDSNHAAFDPNATVHDQSMCVETNILHGETQRLQNNINVVQNGNGLLIKGVFEHAYKITVRNVGGKVLGSFSGNQGVAEHNLVTENSGLTIVEAVSGKARAVQNIVMF